MKKRITIFASGEGTNAQRIIDHFKGSEKASVVLVVSNNTNAPVLEKARLAGINTLVINRQEFYESRDIVNALLEAGTDLVVLAGFLWMIPDNLIKAFPKKIVNIHPALLPKFGGKGMYGMNVHKAVVKAKESETGISIHYVNEHYDEGEIIAQHKCVINENDNPEIVAQKIRKLEHEFFPKVIEMLVDNL